MSHSPLHTTYHQLELSSLREAARRLKAGVRDADWLDQQRSHAQAYARAVRARVRPTTQQRADFTENRMSDRYDEAVDDALDVYGEDATRPARSGDALLLLATVPAVLAYTEQDVVSRQADRYMAVAQETARREQDTPGSDRLTILDSVLQEAARAGLLRVEGFRGGDYTLASFGDVTYNEGVRDIDHLATEDTAQANNADLVMVSINGEACDLCLPWEGQVLSLSGTHPDYPSVDEAESAGLFHFGCYHVLEAVTLDDEGVPVLPEDETGRPYQSDDALQDLYELDQRIAGMHRMVEAYERQAAAGMTRPTIESARLSARRWSDKVNSYEKYREARLAYYQEDLGELGQAPDRGSALKQLEGLGVVTPEEAENFYLCDHLTVDDLNTITRTLVEQEGSWGDVQKVDNVQFQPNEFPPFEVRGDIGANNAATVYFPDVNELNIVIGEDVDTAHTLEGLQAQRDQYERDGNTDSPLYADIVRTIDSLESGAYDVPDLHTGYTFEDAMEGVMTHELGHAFYFRHQDELDAIVVERLAREGVTITAADLHRDDMSGWEAQISAPYVMDRAVSRRAMDDWNEYVAESYAWYMSGHTNRIDPEVLDVFRRGIQRP